MAKHNCLADTAIKTAKRGAKMYRLSDGGGLVLEIYPNGSKLWRVRYYWQGKEKMLSLGQYPSVGLADAREKRDVARKLLAEGVNPSQTRKDAKAAALAQADTFESVAREWLATNEGRWGKTTARINQSRLEADIFPTLGAVPINEVSAKMLLEALRAIAARGAEETARRMRGVCGQVLRYAIATGKGENDPTQALRGALPTAAHRHFPSITDPRRVGQLMRAIYAYGGSPETVAALKMFAMTFVRSGTLRVAIWSEFDLDASGGPVWNIPAEHMKKKRPHLVPLPRQAVEVIRELQPITGRHELVFASGHKGRPLSEVTINHALRRMGFPKDEMCCHGFRHMASTLLHANGFSPDVIDRQMSHALRGQIRATYNHAEYLPERRKMLQWYADYLDAIAADMRVIPIRSQAAGV